MAEPPEIDEVFVREVDEDLRRDRMREFWLKHGWLVAIGVVLFLAACGGFIYWQHYKHQRAERQVEQLAEIYKDIGSGTPGDAAKQLDELANSGSKAVRATALFTRAALAIQDNDLKLAAAKFGEIAGDSSLPKPYRDAALIRQTALQFDQLQPAQVVQRLEPLAKPGNPWFGTAGEMTALALLKQGQKDQAGRLFAAIARDKSVPDQIRERSVQIAGTLGIDESAALAAPAQ